MMCRAVLAAWFYTVAVPPLLIAQTSTAAQALDHGIELASQGDLKGAETAARESIRANPKSARAFAFLGVLLTRQERLEEAAGCLEEALRLDPTSASTRFNLALNEYRLGRMAAAERNLQMLLKLHPDHGPGTLLLGTILAGSSRCGAAMPLLESVSEMTRRQPDSVMALARCYYSGKQRDKARELLVGLSTHPAGAQAVYPAIMLAIQAGDFPTADRLLTALAAEHGREAQFGYMSALVDYNAGRFAAAQSRLEQLVAAGVKDANVFDLLAWCLRRQNQKEAAIRTMEEAIRLEPATGVRHLHLAQMMIEDKRYAEALTAAKEATAGSAAGEAAYRLRGDAEFALGMLKQAEESYARALALNDRDADALLQLAAAEHALWKYGQAKTSFEKGIRQFPDDARFLLGYAKLLLDPAAPAAMQAPGAAVSSLERALKLNGDLSDAHYELGRQLSRTGDVQGAIAHLETAARLDPGNAQIHLSLANGYRAAGRADAAAEQVKLYRAAAGAH